MTNHTNEAPETSLKRKFEESDIYIDLDLHFSKKLCLGNTNDIEKSNIKQSCKDNVKDNLIEQIKESLEVIKNDMGSKYFLNTVYSRYINMLDQFEINNTNITIKIIEFCVLYQKFVDISSKTIDYSEYKESMCKLFSIILSIDTYFLNYYFV